MIVKAVVLFLLAMLILGMFGRWRFGGPRVPRRDRTLRRVSEGKRCKRCGAWRVGSGPCACGADA
ncbi:MAG: hypothetical protein AAFW69_01145 [Pseudomonadota bacterium]